MKNDLSRYTLMALACLMSYVAYPQKKLLILGSSTSACWGPSLPANCYVSRLAAHYNTPSQTITIDNRAAAGFNVYRSMPRTYKPPAGRDTSFPYYSITDALASNPDVILVNYPTNNYDVFSVGEVMFCLRTIKAAADKAGKPCYITTSQPRTAFDLAAREKLRIIKDSVLVQFGNAAIDFWTNIADPVTNAIAAPYQMLNDQVHLNDQAHSILYQRVVAKDIFNTLKADAGRDVAITLPYATFLDGSNSSASAGISSYSWSKIAGPAEYNLVSPSTAGTFLNSVVAGTYSFRLTINDNKGNTATDDVVITVHPAVSSQAPVANAGKDETIPPGQSTVLDGRGSYANGGSIVSFKWTKYSGPATYDILNPVDAQTWIRNMTAGTYVLRLTVTANNGLTAFDDVTINVSANIPIANAGKDQTIPYGQSTVLRGENSTAPSGIKSFSWNKVSGPASFDLLTPSEISTWARNMEAGTYVYRLTVTDNNNATAFDDVMINVTGISVFANAGKDETIQTGQATVLHGEGSYSSNGQITSYLWTKASGPSSYYMLTPTSLYTSIQNMVAGTYVYRLTVTDDKGKTSTDDVVITVLPSSSIAEKTNNNLLAQQPGESLQALKFSIYPNPAVNQLTVALSNAARGEGKIYITDALGSLVKAIPVVKDQQDFSKQIPLQGLKQGYYTIELAMRNERKISTKFFKY